MSTWYSSTYTNFGYQALGHVSIAEEPWDPVLFLAHGAQKLQIHGNYHPDVTWIH